jgi:hypothetical protein
MESHDSKVVEIGIPVLTARFVCLQVFLVDKDTALFSPLCEKVGLGTYLRKMVYTKGILDEMGVDIRDLSNPSKLL